MNQFPALMIGGPPHSGKSVLAYSLTQALRARQIDHYLLRACPDGEGDWSTEADQGMVQILRPKGVFNAVFVAQIHQAIQGRLLPLLVDVGGQPRPDQEVILAACSHAILIAADAAGLATWRALAQRLNIPVIAELISSLTDPDARWSDTTTPLRGRIFGLERGQHVAGPVVQQLVDVVATHLALPTAGIRRLYLAMAPVEMAVDLDRVALKLGLQINGRWLPSEILPILQYLSTDVPLAIYGRGTVWLYAALALRSWPTAFYQFDPRLGWVQPLPITLAPDAQPDLLDWCFWQMKKSTFGHRKSQHLGLCTKIVIIEKVNSWPAKKSTADTPEVGVALFAPGSHNGAPLTRPRQSPPFAKADKCVTTYTAVCAASLHSPLPSPRSGLCTHPVLVLPAPLSAHSAPVRSLR